jgi:hypothetical protein
MIADIIKMVNERIMLSLQYRQKKSGSEKEQLKSLQGDLSKYKNWNS